MVYPDILSLKNGFAKLSRLKALCKTACLLPVKREERCMIINSGRADISASTVSKRSFKRTDETRMENLRSGIVKTYKRDFATEYEERSCEKGSFGTENPDSLGLKKDGEEKKGIDKTGRFVPLTMEERRGQINEFARRLAEYVEHIRERLFSGLGMRRSMRGLNFIGAGQYTWGLYGGGALTTGNAYGIGGGALAAGNAYGIGGGALTAGNAYGIGGGALAAGNAYGIGGGALTTGYAYGIGGIGVSTGDMIDISAGQDRMQIWQRTDHMSMEYSESEQMTFATKGQVETADGRVIDFDMELNMSREFTQSIEAFDSGVEVIMTDPLVISMDGLGASVSDRTWSFDIDADGVKDNVSMLSQGQGYLAFDRNGDGIINDGLELFGARTGNAFAELAELDSDGNGWIDEADDVYDKLSVWVKDEAGTDRLVSLKEAGVGAMYLGSARSEFSLNSMEDNHQNAQIRRTGFYLTEDGIAKSMQQLDMVKQLIS